MFLARRTKLQRLLGSEVTKREKGFDFCLLRQADYFRCDKLIVRHDHVIGLFSPQSKALHRLYHFHLITVGVDHFQLHSQLLGRRFHEAGHATPIGFIYTTRINERHSDIRRPEQGAEQP